MHSDCCDFDLIGGGKTDEGYLSKCDLEDIDRTTKELWIDRMTKNFIDERQRNCD